MSQYKATLVLGNGFDLSLNIDTSYKSFYQYLEKNQFIDNSRPNNLVKKIESYAKQENWYDFEGIIKEYATSSNDALYLKRLCKLKKAVIEIQQNQEDKNYTADNFKDIASEFDKSNRTSLQSLNTFIAEHEYPDFNNANELTALCKKVLNDIDVIQKEYKRSADNIISELKENLQLFLKKAVKKQIESGDNPAIRILFALLGVEYQGTGPAVDKLLSYYNHNTKEYKFRDNVNIVSFNYTDTLILIGRMLELHGKTALGLNFDILKDIYYPIHGTLKGDNLIFGTDDCDNIPSEFLVFKKLEQTEGKHAKNNFLKKLRNSEIVVIYGHSINGIDFDYYKAFFQENNEAEIYIITYNKASKEEIELTLRDNGVSMSVKYLFTQYYSTPASSGFEELLEKLMK